MIGCVVANWRLRRAAGRAHMVWISDPTHTTLCGRKGAGKPAAAEMKKCRRCGRVLAHRVRRLAVRRALEAVLGAVMEKLSPAIEAIYLANCAVGRERSGEVTSTRLV